MKIAKCKGQILKLYLLFFFHFAFFNLHFAFCIERKHDC